MGPRKAHRGVLVAPLRRDIDIESLGFSSREYLRVSFKRKQMRSRVVVDGVCWFPRARDSFSLVLFLNKGSVLKAKNGERTNNLISSSSFRKRLTLAVY
jgi:hypothetical protein